ncbi:hypothetical protein ACFX2B_013622 [Malus domestica]
MHLYPFHFTVKDLSSGRTLFKGPVNEGFYPFHPASSSAVHPKALTATVKASNTMWHQRLGHPSVKILHKLAANSCISISNSRNKAFCSDCALGKCSRLPFVSTSCTTSKPLELVHTDVWGPAPVSSLNGSRYYVLFVDDYTKYTWFFPLKYKSDVFSVFVQFKTLVENFLCTKLIALRSDAGGEFMSTSFSQFLVDNGIQHQLSCPHTPEQNGCAERKHRHLVETARTLLAASHVPHFYWVDAFATAIYLINRLPTASKSSPWELLFHKVPNYSTLRVFGCACFPWLQPYSPSKLHPKSKLCIFLGYSLHHKGYKCLDPVTKRIYISRHVLFDETRFPCQHPLVPAPTTPPPSPSSHIPSSLTFTTSISSPSSLSLPAVSPPSPPSPPPSALSRSQQPLPSPQNYKAFTVTKHPISTHVSSDYTPHTYLQASKHPHWRKAMQDEYNALLSTGTWSLVHSISSHNIVGCKWVFRIKRNPDGSIDRYKARLVAKGYNQQEGLDYSETFSHVAKPVTIRILLTLACQFDWFLNQLDVSNAFLHGTLTESVFMHQPPGFEDATKPHHVCHLHKSLYGLKQAPRAWYEKLHGALVSLGFTGSQNDHSLFIKKDPHLVFVLVYVDDILVTGPSSAACQTVIKKLSSLFPVKDLGPLHYFLGIEVKRSSSGIFLNQSKYILDLLHKSHMDGSKPCATPLSTDKLDHDSPLLDNLTEYKSLVGALQYLTWTRPDLSFAINLVCQYMHRPRVSHLQAVKRILRYLKGCPLDRRSTGGFCIFLGSSLISWSAKKQPKVARSSTEAEYRSLAHTAAELSWISKILTDIGYSLPCVPQLWCNNISAISLAKNLIFHARTKHVEIDYHYIREKVLANQVAIRFVCSQDQIADICTKPLSKSRFTLLRYKLSLRLPQFRLRGDIKDKSVNISSRDKS